MAMTTKSSIRVKPDFVKLELAFITESPSGQLHRSFDWVGT
jgi:hypothetical protein